MSRIKNRHRPTATAVLVLVSGLGLVGCSSKKQEAECEDVQPKVYNSVDMGKRNFQDPSADRCVACVMSEAKFASCQTAFKEGDEDREVTRARARKKACDDAGYKKGACPDSAIISLVCKGEPIPAGTMSPGEAIQKIFKGKRISNVMTQPPAKKVPTADAQPSTSAKPSAEAKSPVKVQQTSDANPKTAKP